MPKSSELAEYNRTPEKRKQMSESNRRRTGIIYKKSQQNKIYTMINNGLEKLF